VKFLWTLNGHGVDRGSKMKINDYGIIYGMEVFNICFYGLFF